MQNIFLGMLFVFLDLNIRLGDSVFGLLPDFVGYILMVKGMEEMALESPLFERARPWATAMAVYTGVLYAMDVLAFSLQNPFLSWMLGLASVSISLIISWWILRGVQDVEHNRQFDLCSHQLEALWKPMAVVQLLACALSWFPLISWICILAAFVIGICYLIAFHKTKNLYLDQTGLE